jgi:hypothetical protein
MIGHASSFDMTALQVQDPFVARWDGSAPSRKPAYRKPVPNRMAGEYHAAQTRPAVNPRFTDASPTLRKQQVNFMREVSAITPLLR